MIDVGMASAAMSVERKFRRKMKTMIAARMPPSTRCSSMACERRLDELGVVADEADLDVRRQRLLDLGHPRLDRVGQRHGVDAALLADGDGDAPACRSSIETEVGSAPASSTRADVADADRRRCRAWRRRGRRRPRASRSRPTVRTDSSRLPCSSRPPGSSRFCARSAAATSVVESAVGVAGDRDRSGPGSRAGARRTAAPRRRR